MNPLYVAAIPGIFCAIPVFVGRVHAQEWLHRGIADSQESPRGIADSQNPHCHHFAAEWVRYSSATYKQHKKESKKPHFTERVYRSRDQCAKLSNNPSWSTHRRVIDRMTNFTECVAVAVITARSCVPIACSWQLQKLQKCNPQIQCFRRRTPAKKQQPLWRALQPCARVKITVGYKILISLAPYNLPHQVFQTKNSREIRRPLWHAFRPSATITLPVGYKILISHYAPNWIVYSSTR